MSRGRKKKTKSDVLAKRTKPVGDCKIPLKDNGEEIGRLGLVKVGGESCYAHIIHWEAQNGPVPLNHVIAHNCERGNCVNMRHLECVSRRENSLRAIRPSADKQEESPIDAK